MLHFLMVIASWRSHCKRQLQYLCELWSRCQAHSTPQLLWGGNWLQALLLQVVSIMILCVHQTIASSATALTTNAYPTPKE